jgi:hypothetical protein
MAGVKITYSPKRAAHGGSGKRPRPLPISLSSHADRPRRAGDAGIGAKVLLATLHGEPAGRDAAGTGSGGGHRCERPRPRLGEHLQPIGAKPRDLRLAALSTHVQDLTRHQLTGAHEERAGEQLSRPACSVATKPSAATSTIAPNAFMNASFSCAGIGPPRTPSRMVQTLALLHPATPERCEGGDARRFSIPTAPTVFSTCRRPYGAKPREKPLGGLHGTARLPCTGGRASARDTITGRDGARRGRRHAEQWRGFLGA